MAKQIVEHLSPTGLKVLIALSNHRFLTVDQMLRIGVAKDRGNLGKVLASLLTAKRGDTGARKPKEIGELDYGVLPRRGRLARVYYLTPHGADTLAFFDPDRPLARVPERVRHTANDYFHKIHTVDFHIALARWAGQEKQRITMLRRYFDWSQRTADAPPQTGTVIKLSDRNINPDSIFKLRDQTGIERLFCFEMANGMDTGKVLKQIKNYQRALAEDAINRRFDYPDAVRVLFVFEHQRLLELVQSRAASAGLLNDYQAHFFLRALAECAPATLAQNWWRLSSTSAPGRLF